jgi:predicted helicase
MLRQRFDKIEIFDLRGDVRRGERAGVDADQGVFNIQVGTAITLAIADGRRHEGRAAEVFYNDSWADQLFTRRAKLDRLAERANAGTMPDPITVARGLLDDMRPEPFQGREWLSLRELFVFSKSGMKSGNDDVFTNPVRQRLRELVSNYLGDIARASFNVSLETFYSYRPLDRRWFFNDLRLLNRPGPEMQRVWGAENVGLYALPSGTAAGPGIRCHSLIPDYHAFRGSYGGYAFPLYDRRPSINAPNIVPGLIEALGAAYGEAITPQEAFDAILCLLSATSYTLRFAEDLEDAFPHVAFPARYAVFREAVRFGSEIRAVETFARETRGMDRPDFVRLVTQPHGNVTQAEPIGELLVLCADGSGRITGLPQSVWNFSVSGYRVLPRWLEARVGLPANLAFVRELRDICGRIAELIDLFGQADTVLDATLREPLSREALNFAPIPPGTDDRSD